MKRWLISLSAAILLLVLMPVVKAEAATAVQTNNTNAHNYSGNWANPTESYLLSTSDGGYTRVEWLGNQVLVEHYNPAFQLETQQFLPYELPLFGGFYEGPSYYFIVYAQHNLSQNNSVETLRVVRYSKTWQREASCSIYTGNSWKPLRAGSLSMAQNGNYLYVHTCHEKYADASGTHHQSKMTFSIQVSSMTLQYKNHAGGSIKKGFVSHTFNQFAVIDGGRLVTLDHGDAYPRSLVICKYNNDPSGCAKVADYVSYADILMFDSNIGNNATGATVGDFMVSDTHYLTVGTSIYQESGRYYSDTKNVYLIATDKSTLASSSQKFFTSEDPATRKHYNNPYLIKINGNKFLFLWSRDKTVYFCFVDGAGNRLTDIMQKEGTLSDCKPIVKGDFVVWYTTDNSAPKLQSIDIFSSGKQGWYEYGGNTYYCNTYGARVTGWQTIGGSKYFFNSQGAMVKGWVKISGKTYYFNTETGAMLTGWASGADGTRYYFSKSSGVMLTGTRKISNQFCVFGDNGVFQNYLPAGKQKVGSKYYYLDSNGKILTGWRTISKKKYYFKKADGTMAKGFTTIGGKKYYFDSKGAMVKNTVKIGGVYHIFDSKGVYKKKAAPGWFTLKGNKYYLTSASKPTTGWKTIKNKKYYFGSNGVMTTGWKTVGGKKYFFKPSDGSMVKGTTKLSGAYYIFDSKGVYKGKAKPGWFTLSGKKYYLTSASKPTTGWKTIKGKKYYFNKSGVMVKGLTKIGSTVYRFTDAGVYKGYASKGIQKVGSKSYYVGAKGKISTGWKTVKKQKYYFGKDGAMYTGWKTIGGKKYYFSKSTGVMAKGTTQVSGQFCKFTSNGVFKSYVAKGKQKIAGKTYYIGAKGKVTKGFKTISGKTYYFRRSDGAMLKGWQKISGKKYYFNKSTGAMITKTTQIDGVFYSFANEGQCFGRYGKGWLYLNGKEYFLDSSSRPVKGFKKMDGGVYYFSKTTGAAAKKGWFKVGGKKYYSFGGGWLATGWVGFDGYIYEFKDSGVFVRKVSKY